LANKSLNNASTASSDECVAFTKFQPLNAIFATYNECSAHPNNPINQMAQKPGADNQLNIKL